MIRLKKLFVLLFADRKSKPSRPTTPNLGPLGPRLVLLARFLQGTGGGLQVQNLDFFKKVVGFFKEVSLKKTTKAWGNDPI